ncbi:hypothetical protein BH20ACT5_BH20ACT5_01280 [soil metagenome]
MSSTTDGPPAESIVPIAIVLDERTGYTLWAPPWEEDDEEWQAFLGGEGQIHLFTSPAQLAHFVATAPEHDLIDHPAWPAVLAARAQQLIPDDDYVFDLDGLYELIRQGPDRWSVSELGDAIDMVERMAECCEADAVEEHLAKVPELGLLDHGHKVFVGRAGDKAWTQIAEGLGEHWEPVLESLAGILHWVDPAELDDPEEDDDADAVDDVVGATVLRKGALVGVDDGDDIGGGDEEFWESVGILPVRLTLPAGTGLTLRCYLEDTARFLGEDLTVEVFRSADGLSAYIEEGNDNDLAGLSTWGAVVEADADPTPVEDDSYDFVEVADLLAGTTDMWDLAPLAQAAEGALDLAEYCRLDRVGDLLSPATELGRALAESQRGIGRSLRPPAKDCAVLAGQWREVVEEISSCLRWHD